jgi:signal transduction histidine kinase
MPFGIRLTGVYIAALVVAVIAFAAIAFVVVKVTTEHTIELRMKTAIDAVQTITEVEHGRIMIEPADRPQFITLLADHIDGAVLDADDTIIISNVNTMEAALLSALHAIPPAMATNLLLRSHGKEYNLSVAPILEKGRPVGRIALWQSRTMYDDILRATLVALVGSGAIIIFLAFIAGRLLAGRAMRPLTDIAAMMSEIEAYDLSERLAWKGPDDELGRLCASFDRLLDRLQNAFERRQRFTADASHELRVPLSVIRAEAELALRKLRDPQTYRIALETIRSEAIRLELLTDALLAAARTQAENIRIAPFDVAEIVDKAAVRITPLARERGLTLHVQTERPLIVQGDANVLERACIALLENALRYAEHDITLTVSSSGECFHIAVCDDGQGFSVDALQHGTDRFWREATNEHVGTGLGLAIVKTIVETCGGTLILQTLPEGGAQVTMSFPR